MSPRAQAPHASQLVRRSTVALIGLGTLLVLLGAGECVNPISIFTKSKNAADPVPSTTGFGAVAGCASFATYQASVDSALQRLCITCHGSGGQGAAELQITAGDATANNDLAAANFLAVREKAVPTGGTTSLSDPDGTSLLLEHLNGSISHPLTLDLLGDDYSLIRGWVVEELTQACAL